MNNEPITVLIKTAGCDIYPHNTIHKVLPLKNGVYPTLNENDRINANWCKEISQDDVDHFNFTKDDDNFDHAGKYSIFGDKTIHGGCSLNKFRRLGYDNIDKTGYFTPEEYKDYEVYLKLNKLSYDL